MGIISGQNRSGMGWFSRRIRAARPRRPKADRVKERPLTELLEPRVLLSSPYISEFMAWNDSTLADNDGEYLDWVEIANPDVAPVSLDGYHLTNDAADLDQWHFPAVSVPGGGYLVVFASEDKVPTGGEELYASFNLDKDGQYLALVDPNGIVVSAYAPEYPQQLEDISYGIATVTDRTPLLPAEVPLKVAVPTDASMGLSWTEVAFDDSAWTSGKGAVGFDLWSPPPQIPGFTIRMVEFAGDLGDITTAQRIVDGPTPPGYTLLGDHTKDCDVVNHGPDGVFFPDQVLPNGQNSGDYYVLRCSANVVIPAGTWSIDVGSDDGFMLKIPGVSFFNRYNEDMTNVPAVQNDTLVYSRTRGHNHTSASFTVPAGGVSTTLTLDFYENWGGDTVELSVAASAQTYNPSFVLLSDGVLPGWSVKTASGTPPPDYRPLIGTSLQASMHNHNASAYLRIPLKEVVNPDDFDALRLRVKYDDGFIAYLNGQEIARRNAPDGAAWNSSASEPHEDTQAIVFEDIDVTLPEGLLHAGVGTNLLAIHAMNESAGEEDVLFYPELLGLRVLEQAPRYFTTPTPRRANAESSVVEVVADTHFSHPRGLCDQPFLLTITTQTADAEIRYTLDGSAPTATAGLVYAQPIPITGTTTVRAAAFKPGAISTNVDTVTYIFTSDVIHQSPNGQAPTGWPVSWSPNTTDYGMDPDVVNNPLYSSELETDLKSIPTFSIVMDLDDLFGPSGIYSNPGQDGRIWERPASLELIYPDGTEGFQSDCGIRIRGGFSRSTDNSKHAFRVFFRDQYGQGKLHYPLFGPDGAQAFDGFDLRTFQNYSWSFQGDSRGIFIRDQVNRDLQLAMGMPAERGNYYHLYINGQYWGLYNTDERPEASYSASYFGGSPDDYDVIKPAPDTGYTVYATDGNMLAWTDLWTQMMAGMASNDSYQRVQGNNPDGARNPDYPVLLDVDNLIDYMLIIFYGGNLDAPLSNFLSNVSPNNFFAARNRNGDQGFKFFIRDAEHTLLDVNENRTGPFNTISSDPNQALAKSNPQYMFQLLAANPEFRLRVADRIHKWFHNGGVLTPQYVAELITRRKDEIFAAVACESARWGDAKRSTPFTRNAEWLSEMNRVLNQYVPQRTQIVFNQLRDDGFYPDVLPPGFNQYGGTIPATFNLTISNPNTAGTIYYTVDGSDPRDLGGAISPSARICGGPVTLAGNITVMARVFDGDTWSALTEASFHHDLSALRVTEIMYNPAPPAIGPYTAQDFEFIELQNTGSSTIDLSKAGFSAGLTFTFADGTKLSPGQRIVLVKNADAFAARYPAVSIRGVYSGSLENRGEQLALSGPGGLLMEFAYDNDWYSITDGEGYSLVAIDPAAPAATFGDKGNWRPSNTLHGQPGLADPGVNPESVVINEVMSNTTGLDGPWIELHNTTDGDIDIGGWFLSNSAINLAMYRIPDGTTLRAQGFVVFTQAQSFGNPSAEGVITPFALSSFRNDVFLTNNDGTGVGGYREHVDFGASAREVTFGRFIKSTGGTDFMAMSAPTREAPNALPAVGPVVITELMYNPSTGDEFIEILNLAGAELPLFDPDRPENTWMFTEGVDYTFPLGAKLPPFGYALVVGIDPALFRTLYSVPPQVPIFGPYTGALSNGGENVKLARPGIPVATIVPYITADQVHYNDSDPWPVAADGMGSSLSKRSPGDYGNDVANWIAGPFGGTPGRPFLPPDAPTMLTATSLSGTAIRLNWIDNSNSEDGFRIERSDDGLTFKQIGLAGPNAAAFDDTGLASAKFYTYRVRAYNGASTSGFSNTFSASTLGVQTFKLISFTDTWRFNQARKNLYMAWTAVDYNDQGTGWSEDDALFYYEDASLPEPKNTPLLRGPDNDRTPTFYFRKRFTLDVDPASLSQVMIRVIVDDGLVAYFNGTMDPEKSFFLGVDKDPEPTYSSFTRQDRVVGDATYEGPFPISASWLKQGDNVIAVMVKQCNKTSTDVVFGLELSATRSIQGVTADIVDVQPDPRADSLDSIAIQFSEPVSGFDLADLRLTRGSGSNLLTGSQSLSSADGGRTWILGNLPPVTNVAGDYTLHLMANGSAVTGTSPGRILSADAIEMFRVTQTAISGTAGDDQFYIRANGGSLEVFTDIPPGATPTYSSPLNILSGFALDAGAGDDVLYIAGSIPLTPILSAGAGSDTLILDSGAHSFADELAGAWSIERLEVRGTAGVEFTGPESLESLTISGAGAVSIGPPGSRCLSAGRVFITDNGVLDVHDNGLIVPAMALDEISALVRSARSGSAGLWSGRGITSSLASAGDYKGVAAVLNVRGDGTTIRASFYGQTVSSRDVLVKCVWNGDANIDGVINADDYFLIDSAFITQKPGWYNGDFNYDGVVNADDYFLIDSAFIGQDKPLSASKPQPATLSQDVAAMKQPGKKATEDSLLAQLFSTEPVL